MFGPDSVHASSRFFRATAVCTKRIATCRASSESGALTGVFGTVAGILLNTSGVGILVRASGQMRARNATMAASPTDPQMMRRRKR